MTKLERIALFDMVKIGKGIVKKMTFRVEKIRSVGQHCGSVKSFMSIC